MNKLLNKSILNKEYLKKRLLCKDYNNPDHYFECKVLELSPSGQLANVIFADGGIKWGAFPLLTVVEVLDDRKDFGEPSPCS